MRAHDAGALESAGHRRNRLQLGHRRERQPSADVAVRNVQGDGRGRNDAPSRLPRFPGIDGDGAVGEADRPRRAAHQLSSTMGLLTFSLNVTLDGCVDHQEGIADDETHAFFTRLMDEGGAMLWGRVTYEMME